VRLPAPLAGLVLALVLALRPVPAGAVEIHDVRVLRLGEYTGVALRTTGALSPRVRSSLERGMPATVRLSVELWRVRPGWFDHFVRAEHAEVRVARDAWSDEFQLERVGGPSVTLLDLDEAELEIERPTRVRLVTVSSMESGVRYYVIARVEVKPLTAEDIEEVEGWLSGEAKRAGKPGPGSIARLPSYMVGVLANLSGLGDEVATFRSGSFTREDLGR
jgi:hypothetical protein